MRIPQLWLLLAFIIISSSVPLNSLKLPKAFQIPKFSPNVQSQPSIRLGSLASQGTGSVQTKQQSSWKDSSFGSKFNLFGNKKAAQTSLYIPTGHLRQPIIQSSVSSNALQLARSIKNEQQSTSSVLKPAPGSRRSYTNVPVGRGGRAAQPAIKNSITSANYEQFTNIGGKYKNSKATISKDGLIDSEHFLQKAAYRRAPDAHIRNIKSGNMASISLPREAHRALDSTGNSKGLPRTDKINSYMSQGNYYKALSHQLKMYRDTSLKPGVRGSPSILEANKDGLRAGLKVHANNRLLTGDQREQLINKYKLREPSKTYAGPQNSHPQTQARQKAIETMNRNSGLRYFNTGDSSGRKI